MATESISTLSTSETLLVICLADTGYRRAGMAFDKGDNRLPQAELSEQQIAAIMADKRLRVSVSDVASTSGDLDSKHRDAGITVAAPLIFSEAIAKLDTNNSEHFTAGGKPQCSALEAFLAKPITAVERDEQWAQYQQNKG